MMMRYDTTREDASIRPFIHHEPSAADGNLAALWRDLGVERNGRRALLNDAAPMAAIRRAITGQEEILLVLQ